MRLLFEIDTKDYDINGTKCYRPSSRAIIIKDNKVAMVHSLKYDYFKFPGGGIDKGESQIEALKRETKEEAGLIVKDSSIKEFGMVYRIQKGEFEDVFIQDNFYYLCEVEDSITTQNLDSYEEEASFTLEYVNPKLAIKANRNYKPKNNDLEYEREAKVLEILINEGYLTE